MITSNRFAWEYAILFLMYILVSAENQVRLFLRIVCLQVQVKEKGSWRTVLNITCYSDYFNFWAPGVGNKFRVKVVNII